MKHEKLSLTDLQESDSGNYTCKASSETGETSQLATLLVKSKGSLTDRNMLK